MASVKFDKNASEWKMIAEFWRLCKLYWNPGIDEKLYWDKVEADTYRFAIEFKSTLMSKELAEVIRMTCANKILTGRRESTDFSKESANYKSFVDFWLIIQKYWIPEDEDYYWDGLCGEAEKFAYKYQEQVSQAHYLAVMVMDFFDSLWRKQRKGKEKYA